MELTGHIPFRWVKGMIKWYHTVSYIYYIYMYMHCMIEYHTLWYSIIQYHTYTISICTVWYSIIHYDTVSYSIIHIQYLYVYALYDTVSYSIIESHTALYIYNINMYIQSIILYHILFRFCMILNFYMYFLLYFGYHTIYKNELFNIPVKYKNQKSI